MPRTERYSTTEDIDDSASYDSAMETASESRSRATTIRDSTRRAGEGINGAVSQRNTTRELIDSPGYAKYGDSLGSTKLTFLFYDYF